MHLQTDLFIVIHLFLLLVLVYSRYLKVKLHLKLLISQSKFSVPENLL